MEKQNGLEKQTKETITFFNGTFRIDCQNCSRVSCFQNGNYQDVKVNNYLCRREGQRFFKITEIFCDNKIICIEDKVHVCIDGVNLEKRCWVKDRENEMDDKISSRTIQKSRTVNKRACKGTRLQKRDRKNIIKNTVKLFLSWLAKKQSHRFNGHYQNSKRELQKIMRSQNFNNSLIQKVITSNEVSQAFQQFVEEGAEDFIKSSRIQDKQSHCQALLKYKVLLANRPKNKETIISNNETEEQSQTVPQGVIWSPGCQENMSSSQKSNGQICKHKQAGFRAKSNGDVSSRITVIQSQM